MQHKLWNYQAQYLYKYYNNILSELQIFPLTTALNDHKLCAASSDFQ